jgi:hypothetical protein
MAELSPAAQAVLDAFSDRHECIGPFDNDWQEQCLAAALRAAADQVVPPEREKEFYDRNPSLTLQKAVEIRAELRAIAAELEGVGGTNTIQED